MLIYRELTDFLKGGAPRKGKAFVVLGSRRVGKTTLLRKMISEPKALWINGELPSTSTLLNFQTQGDIEQLLDQAPMIIIDEAQHVEGIGLKIKMLVDVNEQRPNPVPIFVTGSSSLELAGGVQESAVGRLDKYQLWPISWHEFSDYVGEANALQDLPNRLVYGMYPAVIEDPNNARKTLVDYCDDILFKDIFALADVRRPTPFGHLVSYLAQNVGQIIKYETLASDTGLSRTAVIKYLDLLEQCFIVKRVDAYSKNLANELKKGKKVYFCDLGVRNAVLRNFAPLTSRPNEIGALWENFFFMERYKRHVYDQDFTEMYFWRSTGTNAQEIDFIEIQDGKLTAFEAKYQKDKALMPTQFVRTYGEVPFHVVNMRNGWKFWKKPE